MLYPQIFAGCERIGHLRVPGGCSGRAAMGADLSIRIFLVKPQVSLVNRSISRDLCLGIRFCSVLAILATPRILVFMELTLQWEYEYCFRSFYSYYNPCFYASCIYQTF